MDTVEVHGLRIAFERRGAGPPLVLLHGGLSDHREWRAQLEELSDTYTVIAWDTPGCGASSPPPATFGMPDYAEALAAFVGSVTPDRPHVAGLSWGSTLALELYRRRPDLPRTLLLVSAYAGWAGSLPREEVERRLQAALDDLERSREDLVRSFLPTLFTERAPAAMVEEMAEVMNGSDADAARTMLTAMADADLRPALPTISVPTLLLYGEEDERSPLGVAREMHEQIPGSELVVLPSVGHQCNVEAADRFNDAVRSFLRSR